jgi:hypothetical protein
MLLTVAALVVGARSALFLLERIGTMKVIRVLGPPLVIRLSLLLAATVHSTTGFLPLLEPRMGMKPPTTERTPPPREHTFPPVNLWRRNKQRRGRKEKKQKGKAIETELSKKERKSKGRRTTHNRGQTFFFEYGRLRANNWASLFSPGGAAIAREPG